MSEEKAEYRNRTAANCSSDPQAINAKPSKVERIAGEIADLVAKEEVSYSEARTVLRLTQNKIEELTLTRKGSC